VQPVGRKSGALNTERTWEFSPQQSLLELNPIFSGRGEEGEAITLSGNMPADNLGITCRCEHKVGLFPPPPHLSQP